MLQKVSKTVFIFVALLASFFYGHGAGCSLALAEEGGILHGQGGLSDLAVEAFGDLDEIRERRVIRVLTAYSKTNYFNYRENPKGLEYEMMCQYVEHLNKGVQKAYQKVHLAFIPVPFDELLSSLREGKGDIVAAGMTITPERAALVDFSTPYLPDIEEILVCNTEGMRIKSLEDLSGKEIYVRQGASYVAHLENLNTWLEAKGLSPVVVRETEENISTEDILELVNAGIINLTVVDKHVAQVWSKAFSNIRLRDDIVVSRGGNIAWAVRMNSPALLKSLNEFVEANKKGSLLGNVLYKRYFGKPKWIVNPTAADQQGKLRTLKKLFEKYGKMYGFDWIALAAQGFQESRLDQSERSPVGAIGIMQVLPSTAEGPPVFISGIEDAEKNIHAGVKYLHFLRDRYFNGSAVSPEDQMYFAWAAYNAGATRIDRFRKIAKERGFDPNKWFYNVEKVAAEKIGRETVDYVANINKYYFAYRLLYDQRSKKKESLQKFYRPQSSRQ